MDYRILTRVGDLFYIRKLTHSDQGSLSDPKDFHSLKTVDDSLKAIDNSMKAVDNSMKAVDNPLKTMTR